jgi:hypothetical protein
MTMIEVPGWPAVFRGSWAVRAGLVSPAQVKGSRYRRIFPDVYVPAASDLDLRLRAHAAYLHMQARGVISGYAAAELHRAGCAPSTDVLPDITVPGGGFRAPDGLRLHRETPEVVERADYRSGSRPDTLLRLLLHDSGFSPPEVQWVVQDVTALEAVWIDLAYPERKVGIEYEGAPHVEPDRVLRDIARTTMLTDKGWRMLRFTKNDVYRRPEYVVATVGRALRSPR